MDELLNTSLLEKEEKLRSMGGRRTALHEPVGWAAGWRAEEEAARSRDLWKVDEPLNTSLLEKEEKAGGRLAALHEPAGWCVDRGVREATDFWATDKPLAFDKCSNRG